MKILVTFFILTFIQTTLAQEEKIDALLKMYVQTFNISVPKKISIDDPLKFEFGRRLFVDNQLSMTKNINCQTCHHPRWGSSDGLPFSIGVGGKGMGRHRIQANANVTPRSAPHLYNKGHESIKTMFWDGRILYNTLENSYVTPEPGLNGINPKYKKIADTVDSVLSMQALFPLTSLDEMRGHKYSTMSNKEVWDAIEKRIQDDPNYKKYIKNIENFNIGHIANALGYFQKIRFQVNDTPFDQYLKGDSKAMSLTEKRGALLFMEKARCVSCHNGVLLSNLSFQSVGVPQIGRGKTEHKDDLGRLGVFPSERFRYAFLTQPLRNIALTAPYMHDGSILTLKEVVQHYNDPLFLLDNFSSEKFESVFQKNYNQKTYVDRDIYRRVIRQKMLAKVLFRTSEFKLTDEEMNDLVCFLKKSLTQKRYYRLINLNECEL